MIVENNIVKTPWASFCVPQYNRTSFLLKALESLSRQTFKDFEVCISDDCSPDGRSGEILEYLKRSGMSFRYLRQQKNLRYDGNLRSSISLARGTYCFLLGNDDMLAGDQILQEVHEAVQKHENPSVIICNYKELGTGATFLRMKRTGIIGKGALAAARHYRDFSFVSGVLLERAAALRHASDKWDGSEMYQMFIGCRMLAEGGSLLGISSIIVLKDIQIPGEEVDSYAKTKKLKGCAIQTRLLPMRMIGRLVVDAIQPYVDHAARGRWARHVFKQLLVFTYPFWIIEYRRIQSWRYAAGICLGMRPSIITEKMVLGWRDKALINLIYWTVTFIGLTLPVSVFQAIRPKLYSLAKTFR